MADNRGGPRTAAVGTHTPNRRDLQAPGSRVSPSNLPASPAYGTGTAQAQGLAAVPAAGPPSTPAPAQSGGGQAPAQLAPGDVPSLEDPSFFPDEPVTAGLDIGPGEGSEALGANPQGPEELSVMRALYAAFGYEEFRRQIDWMEQNV